MNEMTRPIEVITEEINFYKFQAGSAIIEIGKRLCEAKQCLPHGTWGAWLRDEVEFSERTAQNFMRIAREYQNPQMITDLGNSATKALMLLSLPAGEREDFIGEAHEIDGEEKTVAEMSSKELERILKELEAERAEKEKLQSQLDLFQENAEKEKDDALDEAYKEAEDKLENIIRQKEAAEMAKREAEERVASMETEMDELRMRAKQTALPDETELERIRKEAEASAQKKAEEAMQKKLEKAKKEAEEAMVKAKKELAQVREETEKKLKIAGSSGITMFKVYFETTQGVINQMLSCIQSVEEAGEVEEAAKIRRALQALCQSVLDSL